MPRAKSKKKRKCRPKPSRVTERIEARVPPKIRQKMEDMLAETGETNSTYLRRLIIQDLKDQGYW